MTYNIKRAFEHKTFGAIGTVNLVADVAVVKVNNVDLPRESIEYLLTFALQSLQDAYAGAKSLSEATSNFEKKLGKLVNGEIGARGTGSSQSAEERMGNIVIREILKKDKAAMEAYKAKSEDEQLAYVNELREKNWAKIEGIVTERLEEERARKAKAKDMADSIEF